jgi:uncharacterized protein
LDGNEEGHSYRTFTKDNKNSFRQVIDNVDMIQRDYPQYFIDKVDFNTVLNNRNSIKGIYEFIYNRYHKTPKISQINTGTINPDKKALFEEMFHSKRKSEDEYQSEGSSLLFQTHQELILYKELAHFLNNYSVNLYISNALELLYDQVNLVPTGACFPFGKKIFLTTHHSLLPCEKVSYKYSLGKVDDSVVIDIPEIARKYNFYYEHFKKVCQHCYSSRACKICLYSLENLDKLDTDEFVCSSFQDRETFKNRLNSMFSFLEKHPSYFFRIIDNVMLE